MNIMEFVKPELMILIFAAYFVGIGLKRTAAVPDKLIPFILGAFCVLLAAIWVLATSSIGNWQEALMAVFVAVTQGVLCAGCSVYGNQLIKQGKEEE